MLKQAKELYTLTKTSYENIYKKLKELQDAIPSQQTVEELADSVYALNECEKLLDDVRRLMYGNSQTVQKACCALYVTLDMEGPIRTAHMTATPSMKIMGTMPKKDTEEYKNLVRELGLPEHLLNVDGVRLHWPGLVEYVSQLAEQGKPLPTSFDIAKTYTLYRLIIRPRMEVSYNEEN